MFRPDLKGKVQQIPLIVLIAYLIIMPQQAAGTPESPNTTIPPSCITQLPLKMSTNDTTGIIQRFGTPVSIKAKRTFVIQAGRSHQSENNIVAIYIGLPTPDSAHNQIVIEQIHSQKAKPENMIFSPDRKTLLIEYFDVPPGFTDEITLTFSLELYQRKSNVSLSREKPYDKQASVYLKHIKLRPIMCRDGGLRWIVRIFS